MLTGRWSASWGSDPSVRKSKGRQGTGAVAGASHRRSGPHRSGGRPEAGQQLLGGHHRPAEDCRQATPGVDRRADAPEPRPQRIRVARDVEGAAQPGRMNGPVERTARGTMLAEVAR